MILAVPGATPVTIPDADPTVAIAVLPLVHVPPTIASVRLVVVPIQRLVDPLILTGAGLTVMVIVVSQPVGKV